MNDIRTQVEHLRTEMTQLGQNPDAAFNRLETVINGIGYISGGYFGRVRTHKLARGWFTDIGVQIEALITDVEARVVDNSVRALQSTIILYTFSNIFQLTIAAIEGEVTWLLQKRAQMERF